MKKRSFSVLVLILIAFVLPNCSGIFSPSDDSPIQTDKNEYTVSYSDKFVEVSIKITYTNQNDYNTYLPICIDVSPPYLEKQTGDGQWMPAYAKAHPDCLESAVTIKTGKTYTYTFEIKAGLPLNSYNYDTFHVGELSGTYRLVWDIYKTWTPSNNLGSPTMIKDLLPLDKRISNPFRLKK